MVRHALNGHVPGKLKDVPLELSDESSVLVGKSNLDLPDHPANPTLDALDSQLDHDLLERKARCSESPVHRPSSNHVARTTTRTFHMGGILLDGEPDLSPHVLRLAMVISNDVQSVIQKAGGHALTSFQDFFKPRKGQACPLSFFNYPYANTG